MKYQAPNGNIIIARDSVQADAFEKAGLKLLEVKEETKTTANRKSTTTKK